MKKELRDIIQILGVPIDAITVEQAGTITMELIQKSNQSCKLIIAPNTEIIMYAQKDREYANILKQAELATPDSVGVMLGAKWQNKQFPERIPGQAYFRKIIELSDKFGISIYLFGGEPGIPEKTKQNLLKEYPNANIVGLHHGFVNEEEEKKVIEEINQLQPNVLFVALGAPKQEKWIYKHKNELKVDVSAGQGGTYDYEAGKIKRAPKLVQKIGIEWLWRLVLQPSRIVRMLALPKYVLILLFKKDKSKGKYV